MLYANAYPMARSYAGRDFLQYCLAGRMAPPPAQTPPIHHCKPALNKRAASRLAVLPNFLISLGDTAKETQANGMADIDLPWEISPERLPAPPGASSSRFRRWRPPYFGTASPRRSYKYDRQIQIGIRKYTHQQSDYKRAPPLNNISTGRH